MKHYGVVHGRTKDYNNEVRKLFGQLKAFMDTTNQKFGSWDRLLEDGTEVRVIIMMNGAVPIYKAMVTPSDVTEAVTTTSWFFESGLQVDGDAYLSETDAAYFLSLGTIFLPENTSHHIQGKYAFPAPEPDWSALTPEFTIAGTSYNTQGYTAAITSLYHPASMYTGLLRSAVQAKYARGSAALSSVGDLFPWGSIDAHLYYGLIRAPDFTYFSVRTDSSHCKACRMVSDAVVEDLRVRLAEGRLSGSDAMRAEAVVLSTLKPEVDEAGDVITQILIDDALLITPIKDPTIGSPLAYGWHYGYPGTNECSIIRHGATVFTPAECPEAILRDGYQYTAYKTTIQFTVTFTGSEYGISASASTTTEGTPWWLMRTVTVLWAPEGLAPEVSSIYYDPCPLDYVSAPLYCWYDATGYKSLWLNISTFDTMDDIHIPPLAVRNTCAIVYSDPTYSATGLGGGYAVSYTIDSGETEVALQTPVFTPTPGTTYGTWASNIAPANDAYVEHISNISISSGSPTTSVYATSSISFGICTPVSSGSYVTKNVYADIITPQSGWEVTTTDYAVIYETGVRIPYISIAAIIPRYNAEAVATCKRTARIREKEVEHADTRTNIVWAGRGKWEQRSDPSINGEFDGGFKVEASLKGSGSAWWRDGPVTYLDGKRLSNIWEAFSVATNTTVVEERTYSAQLVTSSGNVDLTNDSAWDLYFDPDFNSGKDLIGFSAPASTGGALRYPTKGVFPSLPKLLGDYADEQEILDSFSSDSGPIYWLGWA